VLLTNLTVPPWTATTYMPRIGVHTLVSY